MLVQSVSVGWQVYDLTQARSRSDRRTGRIRADVPARVAGRGARGPLRSAADHHARQPSRGAVERTAAHFVLTHQTSVWPLYGMILLLGRRAAFRDLRRGRCCRSSCRPRSCRDHLPGVLRHAACDHSRSRPRWFRVCIGTGDRLRRCAVASLVSALGMLFVGGRRLTPDMAALRAASRGCARARFVRSRPVILGAISLDLFAVLLGGAVSSFHLRPRHPARRTDGSRHPAQRSAFGAALTALYLTRRPSSAKWVRHVCLCGGVRHRHHRLGSSTNFGLSLAALAVTGAADQISVYIRSALVQFATPDAMRGRVSSVSTLFISASNELGGFESGVTAALLGTVPAVVLGGVGTLSWSRSGCGSSRR